MSNKSIEFDVQDELQLLYDELADTNDLYNEVYGHYSKVKGASTGALTFVEKQTSNLISLKTNKLSVIQGIINAKKTKADMDLKIAKEENTDGNGGANSDVILGIYDLIMNNKKNVSYEQIVNPEITNSDEDIDSLLEQRANDIISKEQEQRAKQLSALNDDSLDETDIEVVESEEETEEKVEIVFDFDSGNPIALDSNNRIIDDYKIPEIDIVEEINEDDGSKFFVDSDGQKYEVVKLS